MSASWVSHDENQSSAAPLFNCLGLANAFMPFILPLESCDPTQVSLAAYHQKVMSCFISFQLSRNNNCICATDNAISIT